MRYSRICSGVFVSRPNRFLAMVEIDGEIQACHVKNTGRCKELLTEGAALYLQCSDNANRKTQYDVIAVQKGDILINMDSQAPNRAAEEWIKQGGLLPQVTLLKPETRFEDSRLDFYVETANRRMYVEVKGVTLEADGLALFPDAPTQRGIKHIRHLCRCVENGDEAMLLFVVQMKGVRGLSPNDATHPQFGDALREAKRKGVRIEARDCIVTPDSMTIADEIPVYL
ncbi:MAG: DNA/RNA nuclease SfsA [Clostridiales bacterium]|nr:DNA/RNA nuclease SfsA [Clostridiales bacterium]